MKKEDLMKLVGKKVTIYFKDGERREGMTREEQKQIADFVRSHIHEIITESGTDKNAHTNWVLRFVADGIETMDTEPCEDAISRQAVINVFPRWKFVSYEAYLSSVTEIENLPSVTLKPAVGKWINKGSLACYCSICGCKNVKEVSICPWCKSKMEVWE